MKRDMDLIRKILTDVEDHGPRSFDDPNDVYQVILMNDAGLVEAQITSAIGGANFAQIFRLTWAGHDFLDAVREDTIWKKVQEKVIKQGASWTFSILLEYAKQEIKNQLFGPPSVV